jgi:hypothetical protein
MQLKPSKYTMALWKIALTLVIASSTALAESVNTSLWSDLDDVVKYTPKAMPDAALIAAAWKTDPRFADTSTSHVFGLHLQHGPVRNSDGSNSYRLVGMMSAQTWFQAKYFYRVFDVVIDSNHRKLNSIEAVRDIDLSDMHFTVDAGLVPRQVVVEDARHGVTLIFPLAVGAYDENVRGYGNRFLTPLFQGAYIDRTTLGRQPSEPGEYRGLPILWITNSNGVLDGVAFHITLLGDDAWKTKGPNYLPRSFESHACMRMRKKDLLEFSMAVTNSADQRTPVNVSYFIWNRNASGVRDPSLGQTTVIHPYPFRNDSYMTVKNFPGQTPAYKIGPDKLIITERGVGQPDLKGLKSLSDAGTKAVDVFESLKDQVEQLR